MNVEIRVSGNWKRPTIGTRRAAWRDWRITYNGEDVALGPCALRSKRAAEEFAAGFRAQVEASRMEAIIRCRALGLEPPSEAFE